MLKTVFPFLIVSPVTLILKTHATQIPNMTIPPTSRLTLSITYAITAKAF